MSNLMWVAYITMIIDHVGAAFFPQYLFLRIIGRIAAPIFIYKIVVGYKNTKNLKKYKFRLFFTGIITQYFYTSLFKINTMNICFTLLACLFLMEAIDYFKNKNYNDKLVFIGHVLISILVMYLSMLDFTEYGLLAIGIMLFFYTTYSKSTKINIVISIISIFLMNYVYIKFSRSHEIQIMSIMAIPFIYYVSDILPKKKFRYNYLIYPVHIILFWIIKFI